MLTNDIRPRTFGEVVGQEYPVELLRNVAARPEHSPRIYVIHGPHGTGKTTLARVLARALNCERPVKGEPCLECEQCRSMESASPYYMEFDCGVSGSVEKIREIRQMMLLDSTMAKYRVVVFDEFHMASAEAQSSMLKVFEEMPSRTFVVMCTTDPWKIRETIISRSVQVALSKVDGDDLRGLILKAAGVRGIGLSEKAIAAIASSAGGHARDAVKLVDVVAIVGEEQVISETATTEDAVAEVLLAIKETDEVRFRKGLRKIASCMNADVARALYSLLEEMLDPRKADGRMAPWRDQAIQMFKVALMPWAVNAMHDDNTLSSFFWVLWQTFSEKIPTGDRGPVDRFSRK